MDKIGLISNNKEKLGNRAVDGLLYGLVGGIAMILFLIVMGMIDESGFSEILGRFSPSGDGNPVVGAFAHLAVSGIYGAIFGILLLPLGNRVPAWAAGLVYGLILFGIAQLAFTSRTLAEFNPVSFAIAHLIYGGVTGFKIIQRN